MRFTSRLDRIEKNASDGLSEALRAIVGKKYYDELTEPEKIEWVRYRWGVDVETFEKVSIACAGVAHETPDWHVLCDKKPKPPTKEEFEKAVIEVERIVKTHYERNNI